jgi:glycosyltransferase involved in cell wall biosynthesis
MEGYRFERVFLAGASKPSEAARAMPRTYWNIFRSADLLHVHGEVAAAICLLALGARTSVVTLHGLHLLRRSSGVKHLAAETNLRVVTRAANRTICVSRAEREEARMLLGERQEGRLAVIQNGVELPAPPTSVEREAARAELGVAPSAVAGIYLGSLDPHKEVLTAARAAIEAGRDGLPVVLLVAGDGPQRAELERLAADSGAVRQLGYRRDIGRILAAGDFFVLPSLREGLSFSLLEAMALALPPVVSDAPGNPEAVGEAGIVVSRGDVAGFAAAFRRLAASSGAREQLGEAARERVSRLFRRDEMVRQTHELYDRVMLGTRGRGRGVRR